MSELKPCPFCGGEAAIRKCKDVEFLVHNADCYMIMCGRCGVGTSYEPTETDAAAVWNRRTEDSDLAKAKSEGRLVVLPAPIGKKIWTIADGELDYGFVSWYESMLGKWTIAAQDAPRGFIFVDFDDFGKTAFLTREEAEKALGEGKGEQSNGRNENN